MESKHPITVLITAVEKLLSKFQRLREENKALRQENLALQQKITDYQLSEQRLQQTVSKLEYKNDLAKAKVESIINRLQAIDDGLQETAQARAAAHSLAQTALFDPVSDTNDKQTATSSTQQQSASRTNTPETEAPA